MADYETGKETDRTESQKVEEEDDEDMDEKFVPLDPMDDDLNIVLSDDEAEQELQAALARARQLQHTEVKKIGVEKVSIFELTL